jgi:hypothetical protein
MKNRAPRRGQRIRLKTEIISEAVRALRRGGYGVTRELAFAGGG